ncbi:MAG: hypothetical protein HQP61_01970 [Peptococcaceae bacterium]|nr:hypothetical protein [Candidatus Syntrophopropionicum ammoniitolerans]
MKNMKIKAVLSTTVLPVDGAYEVRALSECPDVTGVEHYIGHPDTKTIVEELGAIQAPSKLFFGLNPGESAICFAIRQGRSDRKEQGYTSPHQAVTMDDLSVRIITRIDAGQCPFCGAQVYRDGWHCPGCGAT